MEHTGFSVVKASHDPEVFRIMANVHDEYRPGHLRSTTDLLSEDELRAELKKLGVTDAHCDVLIQQAREKFKTP